MNLSGTSGLAAKAELTLESPSFENQSKPTIGGLRVFAVQQAVQALADQVIPNKAVTLNAFVAPGDNSLQIRGQNGIAELIQDARLE